MDWYRSGMLAFDIPINLSPLYLRSSLPIRLGPCCVVLVFRGTISSTSNASNGHCYRQPVALQLRRRKSYSKHVRHAGCGWYGTYFVYGSFCFILMVYAWFFVPETKGLLQRRILRVTFKANMMQSRIIARAYGRFVLPKVRQEAIRADTLPGNPGSHVKHSEGVKDGEDAQVEHVDNVPKV